MTRWCLLVAMALLVVLAAPLAASSSAATTPRLEVRIVADEAEAALAILDERAETGSVRPESWDRLWRSEGFTRLKKRQESFGATEVEKDLREFLLSEKPLAGRSELRQAVEAWQRLDLAAAARRAAAYLPGERPLRATIYPVIKRTDNSFVFELKTNPAIFMYIDPGEDAAKLENTLAHELHHVGLSTCPGPPEGDKLSAPQKKVIRLLGAFGEGLAMLAAAGGPNVHPHAARGAKAWLVWERDIANFNTDLRRVETFFQEILGGRLSEEEENKKFFSFISADDVPQGAFYTVGWKMAAMIERERGREALVKIICDPRAWLTAYNEIAAAHSRKDGAGLTLWSPELLQALSVPEPR